MPSRIASGNGKHFLINSMKLNHFVSGSSVILAGWLLVTFVRDVPSQRYPKLDELQTASSVLKKESATEIAGKDAESMDLQVSLSR